MIEHFDAIVIGTGQAGPALATKLASSGLSVAIVERKFVGGTCVNVGCTPTKAMVASAHAAFVARRGAEFGVETAANVHVDMAKVRERKNGIVMKSRTEVTNWITSTPGCTLVHGHARFESPTTIRVGDRLLDARRIYLNVGARPSVAVKGAEVRYPRSFALSRAEAKMKSSSPAYAVVSCQFLGKPMTSGCSTTGFFEAADFGSPNLPRTKLETTRMRNVPDSTCFHLKRSNLVVLRNQLTSYSKGKHRSERSAASTGTSPQSLCELGPRADASVLYTLSPNLRNSFVATQSPHNSSLPNQSKLGQSKVRQSKVGQTNLAQAGPGRSIVILDFGAQYTQLIARRIREQNVFSAVLPCTASLAEVRSYAPAGIVLSGAPWSVYDKDAPPADARVFEMGLPVLGICYGLQFMVHTLGGKVRPAAKREYGHAEIEVVSDCVLFQGMARKLAVWMSHGDEALELPPGFELMAKTHHAVAGIQNVAKKWYAVQFHPEVHHTPQGTQLLKNFIFQICGAQPTWTAQRFIDSTVEQIKQQVGSGRAICALSGGVDSSVAAVLVDRALRDAKGKSRLTCVFVNNGVLRKNEFEKVQKTLRDKLGLHLDAVDATDRFLGKLAGVSEPEKKRKIIGNEFIKVFEKEARRIEKTEGKVKWLVQGTLYPDVIESRSVRGPSQVIKSHHNVGGLPEKMKLKLIEPLKDLFKDEVRKIGGDLGMPEEILQRQPFPGPGLAVRVLGEVTPERLALLRECDDIVVSEIKNAGLYTKIWQSFAVLLPVMSVGVMGDMRTYAYTCAIRAVSSEDGMTADWVQLPYAVLKTISTRIVNEVKGVNRVVYDVTSKPPGTIEWE